MDLDVYQPCPCGSGKKLKFCCSKDILPELDQALRMLEGEQRLAGLDRIKSLIEKHGPRDALLSLVTGVYLEMGEYDRARTANKEFLASQPNNPIALAHAAMLAVAAGKATEATDRLQGALEGIEDSMPYEVFESILIVAQVCLSSGNILAGQAWLLMHASMADERDTRALQMLARINQLPQTSLLLRQHWSLAPPPKEKPYSDPFLQALMHASRGMWRKGLAEFQELAEQAPEEPAIWHNIALLQLWLGDDANGRATLHKLAALPGNPHDDAVEAEALAQLLDTRHTEGEIDNVTVTYKLSELDSLMERLTSEKRVVKMQIDAASFSENNEVPPKAAFSLLDRETPDHSDDLQPADIPLVLGQFQIFGRQTDRDARLEFSSIRRDDFAKRTEVLADVIGSSLGEIEKEVVNGKLPLASVALTWNWRFPNDSPVDIRRRLIEQERERVLLEELPKLSFPSLDGKSMQEAAAGSEAEKIAAEAGILTMELTGQQQQWEFDFNRLREQLNLPQPAPINPGQVEIQEVPMVRWSRFVTSELESPLLVQLYQQAAFGQARKATMVLAEEILSREDLQQIDKAQVYMTLARMSSDFDRSMELIEKAREIIVGRGESPAMSLIEELSVRLNAGRVEAAEAIIQRLQTHHMQEPNVAQSLYQLLQSVGAIDPGAAAPPRAAPQAPPSPAAAAGTSDVWMPGSQAAPPKKEEGGEEKSKLWLPGMD